MKKSFNYRFISIALPVILLLTIVIIIISSMRFLNEENLKLIKNRDYLLNYQSEVLSYPLWIVNNERVQSLSDNFFKYPEVAGVIVKDNEGKLISTLGIPLEYAEKNSLLIDKAFSEQVMEFIILLSTGRGNEGDIEKFVSASKDIYFLINEKEIRVGSITLILGNSTMVASLKSVLFSSLLSIAVMLMIIQSSILIIFYFTNIRSISELRRFINDKHLEINNRKQFENEIAYITQEFKTLWSNRETLTTKLFNDREYFRTILNNLPIGLCIHTSNGSIKEVNKYFTQMTEYRESELIGNIFNNIFQNVKLDKYCDYNHEETFKVIEPMECNIFSKSGIPIRVRILGAPISINGAFFISYSFENYTFQHKLQNQLEQTKDFLDQTTRLAKVGGWEWDIREDKLLWTEEVYRIHEVSYDYTPEVDTAISFYTNDYRGLIEKSVRNSAEDGIPFNLEAMIKTAKGQFKWVHAVGNPIYSGTEIVKINGIFQDITERKETDTEIEKMIQELNHKSRIDMLGRLASGVAHDYNNILGGILNSVNLIELKLKNSYPDLIKYTRIIMNLTKSASQLSDKLLTLSRKDIVKEKSLINLFSFFTEIQEILIRTLNKKINISYVQQDIPRDYNFRINPSEFQNAILNLCINSGHAMENGGELKLRTEEYVNGNVQPQLKIIVEDTGCGMSDEVMEKMFEPFFTTRKDNTGTGLGMVSVKRCIDEYNGSIEVKSELDKGTIITLTIPVLGNTKGIEKPETISMGNGMILLVDDEKVNRQTAVELLGHLGYNMLEAENGNEALEIFKDKWKDIDLVILDMIMPGKDGYETFLEMKQIAPHIKIILLTGYSDIEKVKIMNQLGLNAILRKPFQINEMSQVVEEIISNT